MNAWAALAIMTAHTAEVTINRFMILSILFVQHENKMMAMWLLLGVGVVVCRSTEYLVDGTTAVNNGSYRVDEGFGTILRRLNCD